MMIFMPRGFVTPVHSFWMAVTERLSTTVSRGNPLSLSRCLLDIIPELNIIQGKLRNLLPVSLTAAKNNYTLNLEINGITTYNPLD